MQDGGAEILDVVHSLVMENLAIDSNWHDEASSSNTMAFVGDWRQLMAVPEDGVLDAVSELSNEHAKDIKTLNFA